MCIRYLISKTIQIRRTRHVTHCWRSRDKLSSNILLWTSSHGHAGVGRPTRTYLQQLRTDTGCSLEDLSEAIEDRDKWREREREKERERERERERESKRISEIRASGRDMMIYVYTHTPTHNFWRIQREKSKYFKMNRLAKKFESGTYNYMK